MADAKKAQDAAAGATVEASELDGLLKKEFRPKSEEQNEAVSRAVRTLAEQALAQTALIGNDVVATIEAMIAGLDQALSTQINLILHHQDFQQMIVIEHLLLSCGHPARSR